jgi:hypothetical protein
MKKIIILGALFFLVLNFQPVAAKVLSEDYLTGVSKVSLQAGQLFSLCEQEITQPFKPTISTSSASSCKNEKDLILADLVYEFRSSKQVKVDRLYVFDEKLYRPDDITYEYYAVGIGETEEKLKEVIANELWLTDSLLPDGQRSTKGKLDIGYNMDGKIEFIELNLSGKFYTLEKQGKKLSKMTLLIVSPEVGISVTPASTEIPTIISTAAKTPSPTKTPTSSPQLFPLIIDASRWYGESPSNHEYISGVTVQVYDAGGNLVDQKVQTASGNEGRGPKFFLKEGKYTFKAFNDKWSGETKDFNFTREWGSQEVWLFVNDQYIEGTFFLDKNENKQKDNDEEVFKNMKITAFYINSPDRAFEVYDAGNTTTDNNGFFRIKIQYSREGTYKLQPPLDLPYMYPSWAPFTFSLAGGETKKVDLFLWNR